MLNTHMRHLVGRKSEEPSAAMVNDVTIAKPDYQSWKKIELVRLMACKWVEEMAGLGALRATDFPPYRLHAQMHV
jgi:hypothetical protein